MSNKIRACLLISHRTHQHLGWWLRTLGHKLLWKPRLFPALFDFKNLTDHTHCSAFNMGDTITNKVTNRSIFIFIDPAPWGAHACAGIMRPYATHIINTYNRYMACSSINAFSYIITYLYNIHTYYVQLLSLSKPFQKTINIDNFILVKIISYKLKNIFKKKNKSPYITFNIIPPHNN